MTFWGEFRRWWRGMIPSRGLLGWTAGFVSTIIACGLLTVGVIWLASGLWMVLR